MLGSWFGRRRRSALCDGHWCNGDRCICQPHPIYGRLDGEDSEAVLVDLPELSLEEQAAVDATVRIAELERELAQVYALLGWQGSVIAAAREFVTLVATTSTKSGEPVFKTTQDDDTLAAQALNHRFVDLAALLNKGNRPVPSKLAQGTVH
jgi:hypothetical protein